MELREIISVGLMLCGVFFMVVGALGLLRMPDVYIRMSATTKSATLGVSFALLAAAVYFDNTSTTSRALATIAFLFVTAPVGAHMIARAAYLSGVEVWEHTHTDELKGRYDLEHNTLSSTPPPQNELAQETSPETEN